MYCSKREFFSNDCFKLGQNWAPVGKSFRIGSSWFTGKLSGFISVEARRVVEENVMSSDCGIRLLTLVTSETLFY